MHPLQEAWGTHTTHNMKECHCFNKDSTPKKVEGAPRPQKKESGQDGANFVQIIHSGCKKVLRTTLNKSSHGKKHHSNHNKSDCDSDSDFCSVGLDSMGELSVCKKLKTSTKYVILPPVQT